MKPGDIIKFGNYLQYYNEPTPIEWIVLELAGNTAKLITRNGVEIEPYNQDQCFGVTWENCTLRKWLNTEFLQRAFSKEEQARIEEVTVKADKNPRYTGVYPGHDTKDKVFLLSLVEAKKYFKTNEDRKCVPTRLAVCSGAWLSNIGTCIWWLRTPGVESRDAVLVHTDGAIWAFGDHVSMPASIRPVIVLRNADA